MASTSAFNANLSPNPLLQRKYHECICFRAKQIVSCRRCGYTIDGGRISQTCLAHPNTMFLHDYTQCPMCKANAKFLLEIEKKK